MRSSSCLPSWRAAPSPAQWRLPRPSRRAACISCKLCSLVYATEGHACRRCCQRAACRSFWSCRPKLCSQGGRLTHAGVACMWTSAQPLRHHRLPFSMRNGASIVLSHRTCSVESSVLSAACASGNVLSAGSPRYAFLAWPMAVSCPRGQKRSAGHSWLLTASRVARAVSPVLWRRVGLISLAAFQAASYAALETVGPVSLAAFQAASYAADGTDSRWLPIGA